MKKFVISLSLCALLGAVCSVARAEGDRIYDYDASLRMIFGLGYGKRAVTDEQFSAFAREVLTPAFREGYCVVREAHGEWAHPERGLVRERNVVVFLDFKESGEARAAREAVAREFVRRFPGSHASVYLTVTPGIQSSIHFQ
ncbi:MAG: DUF3574 domain-containing protein [Desulfovibrionaceae bacterium]|nr:DUF3574 domain-containing protein [Desulfovibrionaceae bacterium]